MASTKGLVMKDWKTFGDLLIKANIHQVNMIKWEAKREIEKRLDLEVNK